MGVDFAKKCAKSFQKAWDRGKRELSTPTLFSNGPSLAGRTYCAVPTNGTNLTLGREFVVRITDNAIRLYDGCSEVGIMKDNPAALITAIKENAGCAVAKVTHVHEISGAADVMVA